MGQDQTGSPAADLYDNSRVEYGAPFPVWSDAAAEWYDAAEWANHPNRRVAPAASQYGLPQFPVMPVSAARHIAKTDASAAPLNSAFSGWDDTATGADWDSIIRAAGVNPSTAVAGAMGAFARDRSATIQYPSGSGAKASLAKLDFALSRLESLNAQLKAAEAKVAATRANIAQSNRRIKALTAIRGKLAKLAAQIQSLEGRVGQDPAVQAEVIAATKAWPNVANGFPVLQW